MQEEKLLVFALVWSRMVACCAKGEMTERGIYFSFFQLRKDIKQTSLQISEYDFLIQNIGEVFVWTDVSITNSLNTA